LPKKLIPLSKTIYKKTKTIYIRPIYNIHQIKKKLNQVSLRVQSQDTTNFKIKQVTKTSDIKDYQVESTS